VLIRIILQDRKVIIFDEWTNQLDAENEAMIMADLLKDRKDKLVIFITHRLSTISKADRIYCIEDWTTSNVWTHSELLWKENIYSRFWKTQNN
jgi:ATP-binding cassette subfamily B protein